MTYFLERIAELLHDEYLDRLNNHCLVFPNRRAGLYFLKYLAAKIDKPVWTPAIVTINELFYSYSPLQTADSEVLLFELYKVYRKIKQSPESFDDFYFWADMLVNDFDDIDKYMVDASGLFGIVKDIKAIDRQFGGLTPEQTEIIKRFWVNFDQDKPTREKTGFLSIWSVLNELYSEFKNSLKRKNIAYEGMIFRDVAERSLLKDNLEIKWDQIHFIGFNALNNCEKELMSFFKRAGKANFYWDYDNAYISGNKLNSAGFFLKQNIKIFGNDMPADWNYDTFLSSGSGTVSRRVIDTSSDVAQVKLISKLIGDIPGISGDNAHHTAVVLADENLLVPVLSSLPVNTGEVNITMGYPLKNTQAYTFVKHLLLLQKNARIEGYSVLFKYQDVINILRNRFITGLLNEEGKAIIDKIIRGNLLWVSSDHFEHDEFLKMVFRRMEVPSLLSAYLKYILTAISSNNNGNNGISEESRTQQNIRNEFIYRILLSINRLETIANGTDIVFTIGTYIRILDKVLRGQSVPFSGEPLSGIQIMGILETRALDFTNIIMLSVNEGVLPGGSAGSSFIPFSLREAFGLPTINHQESIFAYHFYRLLQRAENVTFLYNSNSDGLKTGEMSRFLLQMKYEPALKPEFINMRFEIKTNNPMRTVIERTDDHLDRLCSLFVDNKKGQVLSPTAINTWLNCRMRFYYRYVNRLKEPDKISVEIDPAMLGTLLHNAMKILYSEFIGREVDERGFDNLIKNSRKLDELTEVVINEKFKRSVSSHLSGSEIVIKEILKTYILQIICTDRSLAPITILYIEEPFGFNFNSASENISKGLNTGGTIDRIDRSAGVVRIVDYKTGSVANRIDSISDLFSQRRKKDVDGWLQTLLYCEAYLAKNPGKVIRPSIYKIKELSDDRFSDGLRLKGSRNSDMIIDDYSIVREDFMTNLNDTVNKIFSNDEPFNMTGDIKKCDYCPYRTLCMR
jgi:CRISPR/Cas system-associated exonuclease Cas4 (RecB family)